MKYSFVLPAYKSKYLKAAIDSILSQTYANFELIIVNDASPDNIDSIVYSYSDARIKYYKNKENRGGVNLVSHWNNCIGLSDSEYVILASDDDVYDHNYLCYMNKLVEKYPVANVFRPRIQLIDSKDNIIGIEACLPEVNNSIEVLYGWVKGWINSGIPYYIFKRSALNNINGFASYPMAWFSDDATVLRLANNGVVVSTEILFSFRLTDLNISTKRNTYREIISKLKATKIFFDEVVEFINTFEKEDKVTSFLLNDIREGFPNFLIYNKVKWQIFNSSFRTATVAISTLLRQNYLPQKEIIRLYFSYCKGTILKLFNNKCN